MMVYKSAMLQRTALQHLPVLLGATLLALAAQVAIPWPGTPVRFTLQTLALLACARVLCPERAAMATTLYLVAGCCGVPCFSLGGAGIMHLLGPSGGFLMTMPLSAWIAARWSRYPLLAGGAACSILFTGGWLWLTLLVGPQNAWALGVAPFLVPEGMKILFASGLPWCRKPSPTYPLV